MKISVCIPTFNQGTFVAESIHSVLHQTRPVDEIIISNDASTDHTKQVLDALAVEFPNIKVIHQKENLGITLNTNACLKAACGDLIVRLDSDDILLPEYVEVLANLLEKYPTAGYAHANVIEIDEGGKKRGERTLFRSEEFQSSDLALIAGAKGYRVAANILMFRKVALQKVGYLTCPFNFAEDYFLSIAIADAGYGNVFSSQFLSKYRVWSDVKNVRARRKLEEIRGLNSVFALALEPAFLKRNWNFDILTDARKKFAKNHANVMGSTIYTIEEKAELSQALLQLSSDPSVQKRIHAYESGQIFWFTFTAKLRNMLIKKIKKLLKR